MLSVVLLVLAVFCPALMGLPVEVKVEELQRLEDVLENAAVEETRHPELKRVARERPADDAATSKRVAREEPGLPHVGPHLVPTDENQDESVRTSRDKPPAGMLDMVLPQNLQQQLLLEEGQPEQRHFHSGWPTAAHHQQVQQITPHVTFNVPPPQVQYSLSQQVAPIPVPVPQTHGCGSGGCSGGTTIHVHDAHFPTQHVPTSYTATVPFISGYRLTPVIGQKQITLNDHYYRPGGGLGGGVGGGCTSAGYWSHLYGKDAWEAEDFLRHFEDARYFQPPLEEPMPQPKDYGVKIEDLKHQIEHLESLNGSSSVPENYTS